jgi:hypothetical protein
VAGGGTRPPYLDLVLHLHGGPLAGEVDVSLLHLLVAEKVVYWPTFQ